MLSFLPRKYVGLSLFGTTSKRPPNITTRRCTTQPSHMDPFTQTLADDVLKGERISLSRAITLVESSRKDHQDEASKMVSYVLSKSQNSNPLDSKHSTTNFATTPPKNNNVNNASSSTSPSKNIPSFNTFRIGISGAPGVGKSTFIEAFGECLTNLHHRVAVLAVDPSSSVSGGSILGDKTRMPKLSVHPNAYVRPSPSRGTLGGVTRTTADAIVLCEAASYDVVLVETVGVGQSEYAVSDMVDIMVLLVNPGAGDDLQGIKRGIVELADLIIVTKADGELERAARKTQADYASAMKYLLPKCDLWKPRVLLCSSHNPEKVGKAWAAMKEYRDAMGDQLRHQRAQQAVLWMWRILDESIMSHFRSNPDIKRSILTTEEAVREGRLPPSSGAIMLLEKFLKSSHRVKSM